MRQMGDRYSLIIFPEGTRGSGESVAPFKSGMYYLCRERPDLELVPAYIDNMNRVLPKGEVLVVPLLCSVTFGPPLKINSGEAKNDFLARAREALCNLRPQ
jgi:1-acyl-sn-glycerol-3-phosphate acyltransferase